MTTLRPRDPYRKSSIQIEHSDLSSDDSGLKRRIDRIASNYQRLNQKLTEIETLLVEDESLLEIEHSIGSEGSDTSVSDSTKMAANRAKRKGNKTTTKHSAKIQPKKPR